VHSYIEYVMGSLYRTRRAERYLPLWPYEVAGWLAYLITVKTTPSRPGLISRPSYNAECLDIKLDRYP